MKKYRFHLLSLPHLPQSKQYNSCAFTQKCLKLSKILLSLGHECFYYGCRSIDKNEEIECTRFIETHTLQDIRNDYGDKDNNFEIGYDWKNTQFRHDMSGNVRKLCTMKFYSSCINEINKIKQDDDFLLCTMGHYHLPISDNVKLYLTLEPGIGYLSGHYNFKAFESSFIQNFVYGSAHPFESIDGNFYDRVIPNYFDPNDIEYSDKKEDYYLFIGRMIVRKGIKIAYDACKATNKKLIIAGQGAKINNDGCLVGEYNDFCLEPGNWEYIGFINVEKRKKLMAHASATFTPSIYLEPFGGVHVESMLSGTPVITTNFGVYPQTVVNGLNGYRCDTLQDFVDAIEKVKSLNPEIVRKSAEIYLMDNVKYEFQKWFDDLYNLYLSSLSVKNKGWHKVIVPK